MHELSLSYGQSEIYSKALPQKSKSIHEHMRTRYTGTCHFIQRTAVTTGDSQWWLSSNRGGKEGQQERRQALLRSASTDSSSSPGILASQDPLLPRDVRL